MVLLGRRDWRTRKILRRRSLTSRSSCELGSPSALIAPTQKSSKDASEHCASVWSAARLSVRELCSSSPFPLLRISSSIFSATLTMPTIDVTCVWSVLMSSSSCTLIMLSSMWLQLFRLTASSFCRRSVSFSTHVCSEECKIIEAPPAFVRKSISSYSASSTVGLISSHCAMMKIIGIAIHPTSSRPFATPRELRYSSSSGAQLSIVLSMSPFKYCTSRSHKTIDAKR
mmetsp:Transcript_30385/g.71976  ORF Transcript_30385/g.71976 Transcript_30385/m.71976 type:complete len:228 (-) Transcript_30385:97-780(-)